MSLARYVLLLSFIVCLAAPVMAQQPKPEDVKKGDRPETSAATEGPGDDPQEQAWQILHGGLAEKKASRRILAVQALSVLPDNQRATGFALEALKDKNAKIRAAAAVVLGQQHSTGAIPELKEALKDKDVAVDLAAAHALLLLKDPSAYDVYYAVLMGTRKTGDSLIQTQLKRVQDPKQLAQIGISEGIGFVPFGGIGYDAYRTMRQPGASPVRANAARYLAEDPDVMVKDALVQTALADNSESVRLAALDAIAQRGDPSCTKRLIRNLLDKKASVRYRTAAVILHLSTHRVK